MKSKFKGADPARLKGISAVYQFELSGDNGGVFHIKVGDGKYEVVEAAHNAPNLTITMAAGDFVRLLDGKLNATSAFMAGKLKVTGDKSLVTGFQDRGLLVPTVLPLG